MNEGRLRFRLGLFVLLALVLFGALVLMFGSLPTLFKRTTAYWVRFTDAPGLTTGAPVRRSGVRIGEVSQVVLDEERGIVRVQLAIDAPHTLRRSEQATLVVGLLGSDVSIDFVPIEAEAGQPVDRSAVEPSSELVGVRQASVNTLLNRASEVVPTTQETFNDIRKSLRRLEQSVDRLTPLTERTLRTYDTLGQNANRMMPELENTNRELQRLLKQAQDTMPMVRSTMEDIGAATRDAQKLIKQAQDTVPVARSTIEDFGATARTWGKFGERADNLLQTNQDKLVEAIDNLNRTMNRAAAMLSEENQRNVTVAMRNFSTASERLPSITKNTDEITTQGRSSVKRLNEVLDRANELLKELQGVSKPLSERSNSISRNLDESLEKLNATLSDTRALFRTIDQSDGTVRRLLTDPSLYDNVNRAACMIANMMPRLDRVLRDFETFADKLARHPELLGVRGAISPSSGLKEPPTVPYREGGHMRTPGFPPP